MNQHTKSRMDGGDALERPLPFASCSDCTVEYHQDDPDIAAAYPHIALCPLHAAAEDLLNTLSGLGQMCAHCEWWHAQSCTHWEARDECLESCRNARAAIAKARGQ